MSIFSKVKIGTAAGDYNKFELSSDHLTTTDFGQVNVVNSVECFIGDKFKYNFQNFTRVAPMVFPTYGEVGQRVISAFIPFHLVADDADSFISGLKVYNGVPPTGRLFYMKDLMKLLFGRFYKNPDATSNTSGIQIIGRETPDYLVRVPDDSEEYARIRQLYLDKKNVPANYFFCICEDREGKPRWYDKIFRLSYRGKHLVKLLSSLGYRIPFCYSLDKNFNVSFRQGDVKLSAYPLLCYLKMFSDLLIPHSYYQTSNITQFLYNVKNKGKNSWYSSIGVSNPVNSQGFINPDALAIAMAELSNVFFDSDYFTTAWMTPNSPLKTVINTTQQVDDKNLGTKVYQDDKSVRADVTGGLSAYQLNFLRSFDKFVRRNNLIGFREFNAIYSRFGLKPSEMKSQYVSVIDVRNVPLTVGDVTSTSETDGATLGAYAGKGIMNGGSSFEFEAQDYGMFIQISYLYVKPLYYQGIRRTCLKTSPFDYYQPEFDGVGPQAISSGELNVNSPLKVFGFTERYNEYRFALGNITGDFAYDPEMSPWHTGREFSNDKSIFAQTSDILQYGLDEHGNNEFDRIFATQNVENPFDHFYQVWHFNISALRKMQNLNSALNLGDGNVLLDRNGAV